MHLVYNIPDRSECNGMSLRHSRLSDAALSTCTLIAPAAAAAGVKPF